MKRCSKCGKEHPRTSEYFKPAKAYRDGFHGWCRDCWRAYGRAYDKGEKRKEQRNQKRQERYHSDPEYRQKQQQRTKDRYEADPDYREKMIALQHERYAVPEIRDHILQRASERTADGRYRERDRQRSRDPKRQQDRKTYHHKRRAWKLGSETSFTRAEWDALCERYDHRCLCCGEQKPLTPDHVIPLSRGGSNGIENIQPLCRSCNSRKGTKETDYRPG
ncbi:MAG TPA: HNH endonuclease [Plasticicumulans sp.]|nr:HNH endonuclease [Plasticicumulans sp.]